MRLNTTTLHLGFLNPRSDLPDLLALVPAVVSAEEVTTMVASWEAAPRPSWKTQRKLWFSGPYKRPRCVKTLKTTMISAGFRTAKNLARRVCLSQDSKILRQAAPDIVFSSI